MPIPTSPVVVVVDVVVVVVVDVVVVGEGSWGDCFGFCGGLWWAG